MTAVRAGAVAVLAVVALTGAAIAGMEQAREQRLTAHSFPDGPAAAGTGPAPRVATSPAPPSAATGRAGQAPCAPPVRVCVQLSGSVLWLLDADGAVLGPVPVRHGRPDSPTPVGRFPVEFKSARHVSSVTGTPMPFALFFAGDLAIYQDDLTEASAGSIRLAPQAAAMLYRGVQVGDLIEVIAE